MRMFTVPASYAPFVEATLALALAEAGKDEKYREDDDPRVQRFRKVPDEQFDPTATGTLVVLVGVPVANTTPADLTERLPAIAAAAL
jgi:hypothetical protein